MIWRPKFVNFEKFKMCFMSKPNQSSNIDQKLKKLSKVYQDYQLDITCSDDIGYQL